MQAPYKRDAESFERELKVWIEQEGCSHCCQRFVFAQVYVSIHASEFDDCAGQGRCIPYLIPYCSTCEPIPLERGCIHMALFSERLAERCACGNFQRVICDRCGAKLCLLCATAVSDSVVACKNGCKQEQ